jgi:hypothetical protein
VSKKAYCVFFDFLSGHMSGIGFLEQLDLRQTGQVGKNRLQASLRNAAWVGVDGDDPVRERQFAVR